jgi:hypothetical protein
MELGTCSVSTYFGCCLIVSIQKCSACTKSRHRAHGAPIQCTKGKCPKAFHVTCARDGHEQGIVYNVLQEVEKEVVLLDPTVTSVVEQQYDSSDFQSILPGVDSSQSTPGATSAAMAVDGGAPPPAVDGLGIPIITGPRVLKVIKKVEVQVLCTQHNPVRTFSLRWSNMGLRL